MELSAGHLLNFLSIEILIQGDSTLILIEDLLILLVLILFSPKLEPVILPDSKNIPLIIKVEAMLKPS